MTVACIVSGSIVDMVARQAIIIASIVVRSVALAVREARSMGRDASRWGIHDLAREVDLDHRARRARAQPHSQRRTESCQQPRRQHNPTDEDLSSTARHRLFPASPGP